MPDGIPVNFSTTLGTIGSTSSTTNGLAQSTLNGGSTPGVADVSAAVDTETVHTNVNVEYPTPPTVTAVDPANGATDVSINKVIKVTFSELIQAGSTFNRIAVTRPDGTTKPITTSINGNDLFITPNTNWAYGTLYTINIPANAIKDMSDNGLAARYLSKFTTIPSPAPIVTVVDPIKGAANVELNKIIKITFSEIIQAGSNFNRIAVTRPDGTTKPITTTINGKDLIITPTTNWARR